MKSQRWKQLTLPLSSSACFIFGTVSLEISVCSSAIAVVAPFVVFVATLLVAAFLRGGMVSKIKYF